MLENILAWVMVALAIPALLAGAVVLVALFALAALLIIPYVFLRSINYLINNNYGNTKTTCANGYCCDGGRLFDRKPKGISEHP